MSKFVRPTGLMFHHFHGGQHPPCQGSIDQIEFKSILEWVRVENILDAQEWLTRAREGTLESHHCCVTFDDSLLCQYDLAKSVLDEIGIKAFFFVYSSVLAGGLEQLEIYRYFRTIYFESLNAFYVSFFDHVQKDNPLAYSEFKDTFEPNTYLPNSPFYSDDDRRFRYLRDIFLGPEAYQMIMSHMIETSDFNLDDAVKNLWMTKEQVRALSEDGHVIGLHSHSHPTKMENLDEPQQRYEYEINQSILGKLIGTQPNCASHPCNSYNTETLQVLRDLRVEVAFRADTASVPERSNLEFAREDHTNILKEISRTKGI